MNIAKEQRRLAPITCLMKYLSVALGASLILSGCSGRHDQPNVELIQDMMQSPAVKAQEAGPGGMLQPPEGTVPRGFYVYPYKDDPIKAEQELKNPLLVTEASLKHGKVLFQTYCSVCHGDSGHGDGLVGAKMIMKPPALISEKVRAFKDGRIFHIITSGQGIMGSYASQITNPEDRWAVVNFVRSLGKE